LYDIWFLARTFPFQAEALGAALRATFERRKTELHPDGIKALLADCPETSRSKPNGGHSWGRAASQRPTILLLSSTPFESSFCPQRARPVLGVNQQVYGHQADPGKIDPNRAAQLKGAQSKAHSNDPVVAIA
jgi:hypothetical protein